MKKKTVLILISIILMNVSIFCINNALKKDINQLTLALQKDVKSHARTINLLNSIHQLLGYGGFIHHFKNYIIRKEHADIIRADKALDDLKGVIHQLSLHSDVLKLDTEIRALTQMHDMYRVKINYLIRSKSEVELLTAAMLDKQVNVDDLQSLAAIQKISLKLSREHTKNTQFVKQQIIQMHEKMAAIMYFAYPITALFGLIYISYLVYSRRQLAQIKALFDVTPDALLVVNDEGEVIKSNIEAQKLFEYSQSELSGLSIEKLVHLSNDKHRQLRTDLLDKLDFKNHAQSSYHITRAQNEEVYAVSQTGKVFPVNVHLSVYQDNGKVRIIASITNMTYIRKLEHDNRLDPLTKLTNKMETESNLEAEIQRAYRYQRPLSVMFIDIDHFKKINDQHGHLTGDQVLREFADLLREKIRSTDIVGRFGGEEFVIICPESTIDDSKRLAEKLRLAVQKKHFSNVDTLSASFGVSELDLYLPGETIHSVLKRADDALYLAKQGGRDQVVVC